MKVTNEVKSEDKTPKKSNSNENIIYISSAIKKAYIEFFKYKHGDLIAEVLNNIVELLGELYEPEQCSLEPIEANSSLMKLQLKILRPVVKITSENGLYTTVRDFYTEHTLRINRHDETVVFNIGKQIRGTTLRPTAAQMTASYAHSHLTARSYRNNPQCFEPQAFCLGDSSLSSSLYGDITHSSTLDTAITVRKVLHYTSKVLHYTEAMCYHESISGVPYVTIKSLLTMLWSKTSVNNSSFDFRPLLLSNYLRGISLIGDIIVDKSKLPFSLSTTSVWDEIPMNSWDHGVHDRIINNLKPKVQWDINFKLALKKIFKESLTNADALEVRSSEYVFDNSILTGVYTKNKGIKFSSIKKQVLTTKFKGKALIADPLNDIIYDEASNQTTPINNSGSSFMEQEDSKITISNKMVELFLGGLEQIIYYQMTEYGSKMYLEKPESQGPVRSRLTHPVHNTPIYIQVLQSTNLKLQILNNILNSSEGASSKEIILLMGKFLRSTINFNNYNNLINV